MVMKAFVIAAILMLALATTSYAVAVGSPYLEDNTLKIQQDKTTTYTITIQNTAETDIRVKVRVSGIAEIVDEKEFYEVKAGNTNFPVTFKITLPKDAELGDTYNVGYSVIPVGTGGFVGLTLNKEVKVEIVKNPDKVYLGTYLRENGLLWLVIFAVVIGYAWYKRNERKRKK